MNTSISIEVGFEYDWVYGISVKISFKMNSNECRKINVNMIANINY